ncbi:MAG: penicillin-binding protein activator LpoB [Sedimentisphaerales bacterium]
MIKKILAFAVLASSVTFVGCSPQTENVDTINDQGKAVMQLDYRDFDRAASEMVQSMVESGTFKKEGGGRYVVAKGRIVNDTMQHIDTDQLMAKVEQEMTRSGLIVMTAAVGAGNAPKDSLVYSSRELTRDSDKADEFNKDTVQAKGQLIAPELSISGKIIQRNGRYDNDKQQVEYYFQLQMNNLTNGLVFWQNEIVLGKRGDSKKVPW